MSNRVQPSLRLYPGTLNRFRRNKPALISVYILGLLSAIALLAPLLANEKPLYMKYKGKNYFPAFTFKKNYHINHTDGNYEKIQLDITSWKQIGAERIIWAPVTYSPGKSDFNNAGYVCPACIQKGSDATGASINAPMRFRHWLGTGQRGDDLLAGLIHGTRISLSIGFLSMGIASLIGIFLGAFSGYFGNNKLSASRGSILTTIGGLFIGWFYGFQLRTEAIENAAQQSGIGFVVQLLLSLLIFAVIVLCCSWTGKFVGRIHWLNKQVLIHADGLISRLIEIMVSLPLFMLVLTVAALSKPSLVNLMVIIGLTNWTGIARLTRAEMLRVRQQEYIQSAKALGMKELRIILHHALPNSVAPALVAVSFGIADAILIESALSFLGLGVPAEVTTWGSLLSSGHGNFYAWWLVLFPGLCIFLTVTSYNLIGEGLRDALDPKMKQQ
ncbi:MAG: ABC transporter permease [Chitinophagales bacterium]|nr:ABC transporter permease [Chitinophagales bacterium]